jgi:3(or 17)beta-hydroxysteroid dehydrogenase
MRVSKKVAVVTGAAQGIGEAIARTLASEGAFVFACDIAGDKVTRVVEDICDTGDNAVAVVHDVSTEDSWSKLVQKVSQQYDQLDILVNNAGIELMKPLQDTTLKEWRQVQSVNVESIFLGCQQFKQLLANSGQSNTQGASVVNISSIAGLVAFSGQHAYNTSKGAVRHFSKSLAIEFGAENCNIRVNSIHPGIIQTPMLDELLNRWVESPIMPGIDSLEAAQQMMLATVPLGRVGTAQDVANSVLFLASDDAGYVTGTEQVVDGGFVAQ